MARRNSSPKDDVDEAIEKIDTAIGKLREIPETQARGVALAECMKAQAQAQEARQAISNIRVWK
jgi:hypothetical protein